MKNSKKIIILLCLIFSMQLHTAPKNKQQIFLTNEYGQDVMVKLLWKSENFPYFSQDDVITLREHDKNFMIKAPYSFYKLIGLTASTQGNSDENNYLESEEQDFEIPLIASNEDSLDQRHVAHNNYFIIKASPKDSAIPGQKKIYIKGYTSQQKYVSEVTKIEQTIKAAPIVEPQVVPFAKPQIVQAQIIVPPKQQPQVEAQPEKNMIAPQEIEFDNADTYQKGQNQVIENYTDIFDDHESEKNIPSQRNQFKNNNRHKRNSEFEENKPVFFRKNIPTNKVKTPQEEEEEEEEEMVFNPMHLNIQEKPQLLSLPKPLNLQRILN